MGLDIRAYSQCSPIEVTFDEDDEVVEANVVKPYVNPDFPTQAESVSSDVWYRYRDHMSFQAGSYPFYGPWRRELARVGGYEAEDAWEGRVTQGPFVELVNFADNEGVLGPMTSAKLAQDFRDNRERARELMDAEDFRLYGKWIEALTMASDGGLINFR